jgi:uncharacterized protein
MFEVCYHGGGEPTVNWAVMVGSHAHGRRRSRELGLSMGSTAATNGVLSHDQIDWMVANLDGVSLSFDGLPSAHDRHRLTMYGKPSSRRVMQTMERFDRASFRYGVRVTVTHDNIPTLPASIAFLLERFRPSRVQVEPAYQLGRWQGAPSAETAAFVDAFRAARDIAATHGTELHYSAARVDTLTNHFCGVSQDTFALSPDGNVSACYEAFSEDDRDADIFFYGRPAEGGSWEFDAQRVAQLRALSVENREYCRGCFARWHCAGDCAKKTLAQTGELEFHGSDRCHITRELIKDQILERIARAGGVAWTG